jgi:hypothetical protein
LGRRGHPACSLECAIASIISIPGPVLQGCMYVVQKFCAARGKQWVGQKENERLESGDDAICVAGKIRRLVLWRAELVL